MFTVVSDADAKKLEWMKEYERSLGARVKVENALWDTYHGLRPLPNKEECRQWAVLLGVPFPVPKNHIFTQPEPVCMVEKNG